MNKTTMGLESEAQEAMSSASWYEIKAECTPESFFGWMHATLPTMSVLMWHHFYEPWHRTGPVIRLLLAAEHIETVLKCLNESWVVEVGPWDRESDDRELFDGDDWFQHAMMFFQSSSVFTAHPEAKYMTEKLVHCFLNARYMSRKQEVLWGLRYAWRSATIEPKLWWKARKTGRKWWER